MDDNTTCRVESLEIKLAVSHDQEAESAPANHMIHLRGRAGSRSGSGTREFENSNPGNTHLADDAAASLELQWDEDRPTVKVLEEGVYAMTYTDHADGAIGIVVDAISANRSAYDQEGADLVALHEGRGWKTVSVTKLLAPGALIRPMVAFDQPGDDAADQRRYINFIVARVA